MKKLALPATIIIFLFVLSCINRNKEKSEETDAQQETTAPDQAQNSSFQRCKTMEVLQRHMARNSDLKSRMDAIEKQCQLFIKLKKQGKTAVPDTIIIPTIVHVIYSNEQENISEAQVNSQIKVLNQDFTKTNPDTTQIPEEFAPLAANANIHFEVDSIIRVSSTRPAWGTEDEMKFGTSGGSDVVDPATHLNIWVCNIGSGILGYAQFPGDNPDTDGIVVSPQFFGTEGSVLAPFNGGRTATHEVGHWLNLRHIWGDGNCSLDDFVDDTPVSDGPNNGCPPYPTVHCNTNDMTMNYMDYTDDACMHLFTEGQKDRMKAVFAQDGPRESFVK